jgi:hypothetical protein
MFRWNADTGKLQIDEKRFHVNAIDDIDMSGYIFDDMSGYMNMDKKYSIDAILIWSEAHRLHKFLKWKSNKYLSRRLEDYLDKTNRAMYKLQYAVKIGKIKKPTTCSVCNKVSSKINGHHENYNKPFEVIWLCNGCHQKLHNKRISILSQRRAINPTGPNRSRQRGQTG